MADRPEPLRYHSAARRPKAIAAVTVVWLLLVLAWVLLDARWYVLLPFALVTLPAIRDAALNRHSDFFMDATEARWTDSGGRSGSVALSAVERAGIRTRLDQSRRVRFDLRDGRRIPLPPDCTPPGRRLEAALARRGIAIRREFFGS